MGWKAWPQYSRACRQAVRRLLTNGTSNAHGRYSMETERLARRIHEIPNVAMCSSGTSALILAIKALHLSPGSEIIVPPLTFSATASAIVMAGHRPVFADVSEQGLLTPSTAMKAMSKDVKAIIAVDLFGQQADYKGLSQFGVPLIADSCQSVGVKPSSYVRVGAWSFGGRKNVPAGEGGAIYTWDYDLQRELETLVEHGEVYGDPIPGGNYCVSELTACLAYYGMRSVVKRNQRRMVSAKLLDRLLRGIQKFPVKEPHALYVYPLYLKSPHNLFSTRLSEMNVHHHPGYVRPLISDYLAFQSYRRTPLPVAQLLSHDLLYVFPQVTPTATTLEIAQLASKIRRALRP